MENLKGKHIADLIHDLYHATFAGKVRGRFFLTKEQMKTLAGRAALRQSTVDQIAMMTLRDYGLAMVTVDGGYGFIEQDKVSAWRSVPASKLKTLARIGQKEHAGGWEPDA